MVADTFLFERWKHLVGPGVSDMRWRSGIKHDCSPILEFGRTGSKYVNGLGENIELEDAYVYPMVKVVCLPKMPAN